jgi:hypothetical protein
MYDALVGLIARVSEGQSAIYAVLVVVGIAVSALAAYGILSLVARALRLKV